MTLASGPTRTRRRSASTAARIWRAALSGEVAASLSKSPARSPARRSPWSPGSPCESAAGAPRWPRPVMTLELSSMRAERAMLVLMPPGCTVGHERLGAVHDAPEVDVHQPLEVVVGHRVDRGQERDAGVVEHQVDPAVVVDDPVGPRVHRGPVGHVDALRRDLD